jgi:hypothetical protein
MPLLYLAGGLFAFWQLRRLIARVKGTVEGDLIIQESRRQGEILSAAGIPPDLALAVETATGARATEVLHGGASAYYAQACKWRDARHAIVREGRHKAGAEACSQALIARGVDPTFAREHCQRYEVTNRFIAREVCDEYGGQ